MEFTEKQYKKLADICHARKLPMHSQNSGGILFHKDFDGDFIRAGIVMYGHRPNTEYPLPDGIKSVFSMKAVISQIKTIKPGDTVSYGRSRQITRPGSRLSPAAMRTASTAGSPASGMY